MELFAAAGIQLPPTSGRGRSGRGLPRLRVPLLNYKVVQTARSLSAFAPSAEQAKAARDYARKCKTAKFMALKETAVRPVFIQEILQKVLGYRPVDPEGPFSLDQERAIRQGAVDVAIGRFNAADQDDQVVAPFELKGPAYSDLDRIEAGRGRSPVQQAWDYAIDAPGSKWVLVSNCLEVRLYAFGRGRDAYEIFDLTLLDDPEELTRLWLILAEGNLLGGATDALLRETDGAYKDVTEELYLQYKEMRERLIAFLTGPVEGPKLAALDAIEPAQTVLDRVLFIAFAQRNGLLPDRLLEEAAKEQNKFNPEPIWTNFQALFRMVDGGNNRLGIWAYNGGEIVTRNLHGVDLNAESVEITRLSLWLKTARRDHRLQSLEATIRCGNSLVDDASLTDRPFDWNAAFPGVFANGGFDVVIGNPPYVRMELLKPVKPYLARHYAVASDRADLYAYFFERGTMILKPNGRLGFISSSTFFRTGSGENLRRFLAESGAIESVVDFGDLQIFEGVTTYPAILTLKKEGGAAGSLSFLEAKTRLPSDLGRAFVQDARPMPRRRLSAGSWRFEDEPLALLRDKIAKGRPTLGEVYGAPLYGIKTGLNEAFVIDRTTRDRLVAADARSEALLVPFLRGEDVKRWAVKSDDRFLINIPKDKVDIESYPAIRDWLLPFRESLEKRATRQKWWELQQAQLAYDPFFRARKIVWPHFQDEVSFASEPEGFFLNNKTFFLSSDEFWLLAFLNSRLSRAQLFSIARQKRGGYIEAEAQYVAQIALPEQKGQQRAMLEASGKACVSSATERNASIDAVSRRILDLAPPDRRKLTGRLERWHALDFAAFRAAVKDAFHVDIPLRERGDWEAYLAENAARVSDLTARIEAAEREINAIVYRLFDLSIEEIALLERSIGRA